MPKPFRFGIQSGLGLAITDPKAWLEDARLVEDVGFSVLLIPDHFGPMLSAMPALMAAAMATTGLRLGTFVINQAWRYPAVLAKEAATVDLLSGGRLELGLGTGWVPREQEQVGIPFEAPAVRVNRLIEYVKVVKGLLQQESLSFRGEFYQVTELEGLPRPLQQPVPIVIGGGQRRVLSLAAREADIVAMTLSGVTPGRDPKEALDEKVGWVREAAGSRFADLELNLMCGAGVPVGVERQEAARLAVQGGLTGGARSAGPPRSEADLLASPATILGTID
ncbi:MAG: TIGR03621 family F420-dependent LLM class oxidoreductase, partial [Chloroflexota bacterium]|nr:TIGR03621 family F420-dependent LLM class oxidoreductase [Chloroflexota bacterium]